MNWEQPGGGVGGNGANPLKEADTRLKGITERVKTWFLQQACRVHYVNREYPTLIRVANVAVSVVLIVAIVVAAAITDNPPLTVALVFPISTCVLFWAWLSDMSVFRCPRCSPPKDLR